MDTMHRLKTKEFDWRVHDSCDEDIMPSIEQILGSLGSYGIGLVVILLILTLVVVYLAINAVYKIFFRKETRSYKKNSAVILSVYPIVSLCSFLAIVIPRAQILSEALTQITLTIALYSLYLLLIDVGRRKVTKAPPLMLNVLPCCCWPCLPFPALEMTETNLSWLRIFVLQLPIVQTLLYVIILFMAMEEAILVTKYANFLQTFAVISILFGIYGLTVTTKSLQEVAPVTYNALMIIEMLMLCYAARRIYVEDVEKDDDAFVTDRTKDKTGPVGVTNNNEQLPVQLAPSTA